MNWTKTKAPYGEHDRSTRYTHSNSLRLLETGGAWYAMNQAGQGFGADGQATPMQCLAASLRLASSYETYNAGRPAGDGTRMEMHLTVDQLVECINDLHTGGLP